AIVSGGPDSTGYATLWKSRGAQIYPIIFNYGQKAQREIEVAVDLSYKLGFCKPVVVDISSLKQIWIGTQLTDEGVDVKEVYSDDVVVPIRNVVFLVIASAYAYSIGAQYVVYGAHLDDIKLQICDLAYPDCNPYILPFLENVVNMAHRPSLKMKLRFFSPAKEGLTKSQLIKTFYTIAGDLIFETYSCYRGGEVHCGRCESCVNRMRAFRDAGIVDKTIYEVRE
ncbi:MAG: 7-cyano-7-deazaguanine synthase, partial [Thermoplasmata archaeon]